MKAVIYARYSSDNQREESIEGQIRECTAFAEKNGITVLRHYIDRAFSAKTDNRPEFQNMIKDSGKKLFDTVIVWKLDRFARNRYDSARHKATLKKNGVKVVSATEAIADGSVGIMMETILEGMAEYYSAELAEKVTLGLGVAQYGPWAIFNWLMPIVVIIMAFMGLTTADMDGVRLAKKKKAAK